MQDIEVEVTLTTGKSYSSVLPADSPLLRDLFVSVAGGRGQQGRQAPNILLQLPIESGEAACSFMSSDLVSIVTRPPLLIAAGEMPPQVLKTTHGAGGIANYVSIEHFLTPEENRQLFAYATENEPNFTGSKVIIKDGHKEDGQHRKSRVLFSIEASKWQSIFAKRLNLHLPHILDTLGQPERKFTGRELQLTASNDGDFFKRHKDVDHSDKSVANRFLTFVYYFHRNPKPYSGGEILFYASDNEALSKVTAVAPENNLLIAFLSEQSHEVDLVKCHSGEFEDSRFTVNGWLRVAQQ